MLFALGLGHRVVAVGHECDWPPEAAGRPKATFSLVDGSLPSGAIDDQVKRMLAAKEPLYGIDARLLADVRPELIVTQAQCDVCAVRYADVLELVARTPALAQSRVVALNPTSLADVLADIRRVADAAGAPERGRELALSLQQRIHAVSRAIEPLAASERPRTAIVEWTEPLMLAGNWMPELLTLAGGACPLAVAGRHSEYVAWERIVAFDPQAIVVAPCGFGLERSLQEAAALSSRLSWRELSAVRNGRVYAVDGNAFFNRSGPRLVDSLEILAHLLHPDRVPRPGWGNEPNPPWQAV